MYFKYNNECKRYEIYFDCNEEESCTCNEKIIQFFNNNSTCAINNLLIAGLDHIEYDSIKNKINNKLYVKKLFILSSRVPVGEDILNLNVLKLLFYPNKIEFLDINYSQQLYISEVCFKKLKCLRMHVCNKRSDVILPLDCFLPSIVEHCPNIEEFYLERACESGDESLECIIKYLTKLKKNLMVDLMYTDDEIYREYDQKYIKDNNLKELEEETFIFYLEKIDVKTVLYKLPDIDEEEIIYVTIREICDGP